MIFDHGEIGSGLVDLPQCELVLICHINRHQRSTFANPRNSRNLRRCPLVSSKCEWPTSVLVWSARRNVRMFSSGMTHVMAERGYASVKPWGAKDIQRASALK
jgi:hypothetical protein